VCPFGNIPALKLPRERRSVAFVIVRARISGGDEIATHYLDLRFHSRSLELATLNARMALVGETIWAMARSRLTSGWKKIFCTVMPFSICASMSLMPLTLELIENDLDCILPRGEREERAPQASGTHAPRGWLPLGRFAELLRGNFNRLGERTARLIERLAHGDP
jgi:hypothetical protein